MGRAAGRLAAVVGVTVSRPAGECRDRVHRLGGEAAADLDLERPGREDVDVRDGWAGEGYGIPSREGHAATELLARTEGVLLDPVFGAKAMAALVAEARGGRCREGPVVFLVTGGTPPCSSGPTTGAVCDTRGGPGRGESAGSGGLPGDGRKDRLGASAGAGGGGLRVGDA